MLTQYQTDTQNLLQLPGAPTSLYDLTSITSWINKARGQLAGEAECVRVIGTISTVVGQVAYNFSSINIGTPATSGVEGVINVQTIQYAVGTGQKWLTPRPWPWFQLYNLNNPVPAQSFPGTWSQFGQGASPGDSGTHLGGSFYIDPPPDQAYTLYCDCVCYPIKLADDTTPEAIPYLWTDAVPFFAAYYAYLSAQTGARQADAERMFNHYETFLERARKASNSSILRWQSPQAEDPAQASKYGLKPASVGG